MLQMTGSVLTMLGWLGLLAYGVAWLTRYRASPDDSRATRASWMASVAVLLAVGAIARWLGADQFSKALVANLAMAAFCGISWAELAGFIKRKR